MKDLQGILFYMHLQVVQFSALLARLLILFTLQRVSKAFLFFLCILTTKLRYGRQALNCCACAANIWVWACKRRVKDWTREGPGEFEAPRVLVKGSMRTQR